MKIRITGKKIKHSGLKTFDSWGGVHRNRSPRHSQRHHGTCLPPSHPQTKSLKPGSKNRDGRNGKRIFLMAEKYLPML